MSLIKGTSYWDRVSPLLMSLVPLGKGGWGRGAGMHTERTPVQTEAGMVGMHPPAKEQ